MKMVKTPSPWKKRTNGRRQEQPPGTGHPAKAPDIRPLEIYTASPVQKKLQRPDIRHPARTSGTHRKSGQNPRHPAPATREHRSLPRQAGHPAIAPDIRCLPKHRTSSPSEQTSGVAHPESRTAICAIPDIRLLSPDIQGLTSHRTSGPRHGHPAPSACAQLLWAVTHVSLRPFDYIYSLLPYVLGLALICSFVR